MRRVICFAVLGVFVSTGMASALELQGRLTAVAAKSSFTIETRSEATTLWIDVPKNCRLVVQAEAGGEVVQRARLKLTETLLLPGMKEWKITVFWDSVDCNWGCRLASGEEPVLKRVQGYADTLTVFRWRLVTEEDVEKWMFNYPRDATFIVRWSAVGMKGVEEQDLADSREVKLIGAGVWTVEVDPREGAGEFTAERVQ